ncbi:hypothetical protein [Micromonospora sp. DT31]|uniref:hypothetical protein n=1 Tax=Micromonospora sp. DT31 TaxID=3393434 RepID=UPI003CF3058F
MQKPVSLRSLLPDDLPVLERLWQLYRHDLSEFRGMLPDVTGLFAPGRLPHHLHDTNTAGYLIRRDENPVGFAFVSGVTVAPLRIVEFFVVRAVRRSGVGSSALFPASRIFLRTPGCC